MKKIICLTAVVLMVVSVEFADEMKMKKIAAKDLPGLKGTWEGMLDYGMVGGIAASSNCTLEILNDKVPVQAKFTVLNTPDFVAPFLGLTSGKHEYDLDDGQITSHGTILWITPDRNAFELSMGRGSYLDATYWYKEIKGTALLKKKK